MKPLRSDPHAFVSDGETTQCDECGRLAGNALHNELRIERNQNCVECGNGWMPGEGIEKFTCSPCVRRAAENRRDQNATAAMQALVALTDQDTARNRIAEESYALADAMEVARVKQ